MRYRLKTSMITEFKNEHSFLSNFWMVPILFNGIVYPSTEHYYQAMKSTDLEFHRMVAAFAKPGEAKHAGQPGKVKIRDNWDAIRINVMLQGLRLKFAPGSELAALLLATGDQKLVEGNFWNDKFWGVCLKTGKGENHLGKLLMKVRTELR